MESSSANKSDQFLVFTNVPKNQRWMMNMILNGWKAALATTLYHGPVTNPIS
jgi:hypothetical protein